MSARTCSSFARRRTEKTTTGLITRSDEVLSIDFHSGGLLINLGKGNI